MSLDGIAIRTLTQELSSTLKNGRIDKITQPDVTSLVLSIRAQGANHKLYLTILPQSARAALTEAVFQGMQTPPQFCMVLRKHLQGAVIEHISQDHWDRIIHFRLRGRNEIGEVTTFKFVLEIMGKNSNIILLNHDHIILDAMKRVGANTNKFRQLQPGLSYVEPPKQDKLSLEALTLENLSERLIDQGMQKTLSKALLNTISGLGPQTIREMIIRSGLNEDTRIEYLGALDYQKILVQLQALIEMSQKQQWQPTLVLNNREALAFAPFHLSQFESFPQKSFESMSKLVETYYAQKEQEDRFNQKKSSLHKILRHEIDRCEKKLTLQLEKVDDLDNAEQYRIYGELLTANLYRIKQGTHASVENFYKEGSPEEIIELNPTKTPNENAQAFFKKYNKAKIGAEKAAIQAEKSQEELSYLQSILDSLETALNDNDLVDIRIELENAGYAKRRYQAKGKEKKYIPSVSKVVIDGYDVYVGKNNQQNDYVTTKIGRNADLWLHTKEIHGAHVIVKAKQNIDGFSNQVIESAALLAAWFSKGKFGANIPVDYTLRKNVHKPSGAKPGMVIYTDQQTCYVTPEETVINQLLEDSSS